MKNFLHKSLSAVLVLTIVLSLFAGLSFQSGALSSSGSCGENLTYSFNSTTGLLTIIGNSSMTDYFDDSPFRNNSFIKTVLIENGVTSIGTFAFTGCKSLTTVTIPNSVISIGNCAFSECSGLISITIPDSVKSIGSSAFADCSSLTDISIPNSIKSILYRTFAGCGKLTSLSIPSSVISIGDYAFSGCSELKSLIIPCSARITNHSFCDCSKIENVTLSKGTGSMSSFGKYYDEMACKYEWRYQYTPWYISKCKEIVIEDGVYSIGEYAFKDCNWLTSITIPDSVTRIGSSAFSGCSGLTSITIPDSVTSIGDSAFSDCSGLIELTMPCSAKIYNSENNFKNCTSIEKVTLTKGTGTMQNYGTSTSTSATDTYYQYTPWYIYQNNLKELKIEDGVTSIGNYAFYSCSGLTSITIPDSVTSIGENAFYNCNNLKHLILGTGIQTIDKTAFANLNQITLPADKKIDFSCFDNCNDLQVINLTSGETGTMADWSSDYADSLWYLHMDTIREINLEDGITSISESAFYSCSNLIKTNVPASVKSIGRYAYYGCSNLRNITILSPKCEILGNENTIDRFATIYGYNNSTAQQYAQKYDRDFVSLGDFVCLHKNVVTDETVTPTCTKTGLTEGKHCSYCSAVLVEQETIPALGHAYQEQITKNATCTDSGEATYTCENCGDIYTENISALGHTPTAAVKENEVAATCTAVGSYDEVIKCSVCGAEISRTKQSSPALGHSWSAWKVTKKATCTAAGTESRTCARDGAHVQSRSIPATGHQYSAKVVKPTSTSLGYTLHSCSGCGASYQDTFKAPTGKQTLKCKARTAAAQTVIWNNVKSATGYQVQISTKDGKKWSTCANLKAGVTSYTFKKLAAGNNYKFRVRFYIKAADDKNYYSPWSATLNSPTLPTGTTLTKLSPSSKAFTAQWKANKTVTGYQIQYSTNSKFTGAKTVTVKSNKTLKTTAKKLSAKKVYYVRIRTYKTISKVNYFSTWSKAVKVKTK